MTDRLQEWSSVRGELDGLCEARSRTEHEAEQQQVLLETLRTEAAALQASRAAAQAEMEAIAVALDEQREAAGEGPGPAREQQAQMDRRLRDVDRAEQAAQRRIAELDELEVRLREEFEEQERRLAAAGAGTWRS